MNCQLSTEFSLSRPDLVALIRPAFAKFYRQQAPLPDVHVEQHLHIISFDLRNLNTCETVCWISKCFAENTFELFWAIAGWLHHGCVIPADTLDLEAASKTRDMPWSRVSRLLVPPYVEKICIVDFEDVKENSLDSDHASLEVATPSFFSKSGPCWHVIRLSLILCPLWFLMNFTFNIGSTFNACFHPKNQLSTFFDGLRLNMTSVASNTVLGSSSSFFVLLGSRCVLKQSIGKRNFLGVILTMIGVIMVSNLLQLSDRFSRTRFDIWYCQPG